MVSLKESCFSQFPKLKDSLDGIVFKRMNKLNLPEIASQKLPTDRFIFAN